MKPGAADDHVLSLFTKSVERAPQHVAVVRGDETWTRLRLHEESDRLAAALRERIGASGRVAFRMHKSPEAIAFILGALKAGITFVPLNREWPASRSLRILELATPALVVTDDTAFAHPTIPTVKVTDLSVTSPSVATVPVAGDQIAYIIFTSGSTGDPKGVQITRASLDVFARNIEQLVSLRDDQERLICLAELSFDQSVQDWVFAFLGKGELHLVGSTTPPMDLVTYVTDHRITYLSSVGTTFALIAASRRWLKPGQLGSLRHVCVGGSAFYTKVARELLELLPDAALYNLFGPTEATVYCSGYRVTRDSALPRSTVPIGRPFSGQRFLYDDGQRITGAPGTEAELLIAGTQLMAGYIGVEHSFEVVQHAGQDVQVYRSGDLFTGAGDDVTFVSRKGGFIKSRGYRISPAEIENAFLQHPAIRECALIGVADPVAENLPVLYYVANAPVTAAELTAFVADKLASYSVPRELLATDGIPKSSSGKIDYAELQRRYEHRGAVAATTTALAPAVPAKSGLVHTWSRYRARWKLRQCSAIGRDVVGDALIRNEGIINLGERCQLLAFPGVERSLLAAGPNGTVEIGAGTIINYGTVISALSRVDIGTGVSIGMQCIIADTRFPGDPRARELEPPRPVKIGNDVWLAARVVVLPGVTIHDGAVVMAGSIVTEDLPAGVIAGGNPARPERMRKRPATNGAGA